MTSKIVRPLALAALVLSAGSLSAGTATAATPVSGSVEVCTGIPVGPVELSFCL
ncbi:hypothetical protein [Nocardia bhagyanarayanae]|uniref:Uncharacterized protein n=1 Tax=Nocardia bhagyanarayanae TaxID=1215925 RepID=A0A543FHM8_9NOCA|nr:hypothetical protein [Nocardia bhagyanarayanae]TQM33272.1 hypothetical protein FB390_4995 [Nocardia bhagyanarayanae]